MDTVKTFSSTFTLILQLLPILTSLVCLFIFLRRIPSSIQPRERSVYRTALAVLVCEMLMWCSAPIYTFKPGWLAWLNPLMLLSMLISVTAFMRYIFALTRLPGDDTFPWWHYCFPVGIAVVFAVWSAFIPTDVRIEVFQSYGVPVAGYETYGWWMHTKPEMRFWLCVLYVPIAIRRLVRYRHEIVNYSANNSRTSLRWVWALLAIIAWQFVGILLLAFIMPRPQAVQSYMMLLIVPVAMVQTVIILVNTLRHNYVLMDIQPAFADGETPAANTRTVPRKPPLTRQAFEEYMSSEKPYLSPDLKITDITAPLNTNRTYLSSFINQEYGMNFSRYINNLRLGEVKRLAADSRFSDKTLKVIVQEAGFGSYNSYRRAKQYCDDMSPE